MYVIRIEERSLRTIIIVIIFKKKHFERRQEDLLIMQLAIFLNCRNMINAIDTTSINNLKRI